MTNDQGPARKLLGLWDEGELITTQAKLSPSNFVTTIALTIIYKIYKTDENVDSQSLSSRTNKS